ncbi:Putative proteasome subunit alpha type-7 [Brettanomyces nanus]|uniref:Proteasome subunit alpha type n=1 Tax=Eeniella nana TaxID=13502 RepID=A0A875RYD9_EENNA|nr:Putative proteasome subunit alpha type-7 [Brettanomyces nanus]QPG72932.1 Putative proteasome subunit alpha type-7 [Brettanomyces nanus]
MTSIGTGYDLANSIFSPDGRNFQVEYASKAVENSGTSVGICCKDGVVLATEKVVNSKLLVPGKNKRIQSIDRHIGVVYSGLIPDGRHFVNRGREEARSFRSLYKEPIGLKGLIDRLGYYVQAYTCYNSVRPFGINAIVGGVDSEGSHLYMVEPSGTYWGYYGTATGKGRQTARAELEKLDLPNISAKDAVKEAARIIYMAHEDNKDKDFELEVSWVSQSETKGVHQLVPKELFDEAVKYAEEEQDSDDDDDDDEGSENSDQDEEME